MCRVLTIYKVGSIGLHGEIEAVRFAGFYSDVGGSFVEITGWLKRCVLVNGDANGVIVRGMGWRSEYEWRSN